MADTACPCCAGTGRMDLETTCANCGSPLAWHLPPEQSCTREDLGGTLRQVPGVFLAPARQPEPKKEKIDG
jgi:hypothetical protein